MHDDGHIGLAELPYELPAHAAWARRTSRFRIRGHCQGFEGSETMTFEDGGSHGHSFGAGTYRIGGILNIGSGNISASTGREGSSVLLDKQRRADLEVRVPTYSALINVCLQAT